MSLGELPSIFKMSPSLGENTNICRRRKDEIVMYSNMVFVLKRMIK